MEGLIEGRIVHYMPNEKESGHSHHMAAIVVRVFGGTDGIANLTVFPDWLNDGHSGDGVFWATSRKYSEGKEPMTWHWPEKK